MQSENLSLYLTSIFYARLANVDWLRGLIAMKVVGEHKLESFKFIELEKSDIVEIYELFDNYYKEVTKGSDSLDIWNVTIDRYEIESIEDLRKFDEKFNGSLHFYLRIYGGVELSLSMVDYYILDFTWNDENIISSGLANKIIGIMNQRKNKFLSFIASSKGNFVLTSLVLGAIISNYGLKMKSFGDFGSLLIILILSLAFVVMSSWVLERKVGFKLNFKQSKESIFKTHQAEIKVGVVVSIISGIIGVLLTLLAQAYFK